MPDIPVGHDVVVDLITTEAPFSLHGKYCWMDDHFLTIEGTVGEYIGKTILIPRNRIAMIEYKNG